LACIPRILILPGGADVRRLRHPIPSGRAFARGFLPLIG
jgi:hypothetical protein